MILCLCRRMPGRFFWFFLKRRSVVPWPVLYGNKEIRLGYGLRSFVRDLSIIISWRRSEKVLIGTGVFCLFILVPVCREEKTFKSFLALNAEGP